MLLVRCYLNSQWIFWYRRRSIWGIGNALGVLWVIVLVVVPTRPDEHRTFTKQIQWLLLWLATALCSKSTIHTTCQCQNMWTVGVGKSWLSLEKSSKLFLFVLFCGFFEFVTVFTESYPIFTYLHRKCHIISLMLHLWTSPKYFITFHSCSS
jgi:hypothetical protein